MSGRLATAKSSTGTTDSSSSKKLTVDSDDVTWHQNADDDVDVSLEPGCLKLGDDETGEDNNNTELRPRHRFTTWFKLLIGL